MLGPSAASASLISTAKQSAQASKPVPVETQHEDMIVSIVILPANALLMVAWHDSMTPSSTTMANAWPPVRQTKRSGYSTWSKGKPKGSRSSSRGAQSLRVLALSLLTYWLQSHGTCVAARLGSSVIRLPTCVMLIRWQSFHLEGSRPRARQG